ncbi:MAG: adenosylcobinamide-GDP ribazoletransferase [Acidobacteria bacterium]|nr:adenosylcobinamide-GDP ribazoletransferase [Acidobacteriota bacterium]
MGLVAEAAVAAVQMLTRIPVPSPPRAPDERTLALSAVFYPWVGMALGAVGLMAFQALAADGDAGFAAVAALALWALATGALHEDGLADVADAFGSQRDKEGLLRVMKDSRIGAYGALALLLATLARWTLLTELARGGAALGFLASQSLARGGIVLLAVWAGPATEGSGGALARSAKAWHALAALAAPTLLLLGMAPAPEVLACLVASLAMVAGAAVYFRARLGGVTGDCLGAAFLAQEIAILWTVRAVTQ